MRGAMATRRALRGSPIDRGREIKKKNSPNFSASRCKLRSNLCSMVGDARRARFARTVSRGLPVRARGLPPFRALCTY